MTADIRTLLTMARGQVDQVRGSAFDILSERNYSALTEASRNIDATLSALEAEGGTAVKVKTLEWTRNLHGVTHWAETPFGSYAIDPTRAKPTRFMWSGVTGDWITVDTFEAAKAAAQADYERRIRSALEGGNHAE